MNKVTHLVLPLSLISTDVLAENKTETVPITEKQTSDTIVVRAAGNDSNLLIVFYVQIMPDDLVMQLHRF